MSFFERCPVCHKIVFFTWNCDYFEFKTEFGFWASRLLHKKCYKKYRDVPDITEVDGNGGEDRKQYRTSKKKKSPVKTQAL